MAQMKNQNDANLRWICFATQVFIPSTHCAVCKQIGSTFACLKGCDAISFTAGIGEHSPFIREKILNGLECLGMKLNFSKNNEATKVTSIECISLGQ